MKIKNMNPITKSMTDEEYKTFTNKCFNSEEYFYENYIRKLPGYGDLPKYSPENMQIYRNKSSVMVEKHKDKWK